MLKEKEAKESKSSELRRLKRKVKSGEGSSVCAIGEAKEAMHAEFQTRLARIADSLDSLAAIHISDLALAGVEGGTNEVGEAPLSPRAEGATLPVCRVELVDAEGDFGQILAGLKSEYILPSCSGGPEGQDPVTEDAEEARLRSQKGRLAKVKLFVQRMIEFAVSCETFISMFLFRPSVAVFILGLAACGFESPSLLRFLNDLYFFRFLRAYRIIYMGVEGRL